MLSDVVSSPAAVAAMWGFAGAFIYAGPKWIGCLFAASKSGGSSILCLAEMVVALAVGAIAAGAWTEMALTLGPLKAQYGVAALIGLVANTAAPRVVEAVSGRLTDVIGASKAKD